MLTMFFCNRRKRSLDPPVALSETSEIKDEVMNCSSSVDNAWMKAPAVLPNTRTQELFLALTQNAANWIEEETKWSNSNVNFSQMFASHALTCVAIHVPTTVNHLKSMELFEAFVLRAYGERIVRCVQEFVEKHSLKEILCRNAAKCTKKSCQDLDWPTLERNVTPCLLPQSAIAEIELVLIELKAQWAKNERSVSSDKQVGLDYVSTDALKSIAFHAPTKVEDLEAIGSLETGIIRDYGERLILAIQMVTTKNVMQQELGTSLHGTLVNFDIPLTPVYSTDSTTTMPSTPSSSFSGTQPETTDEERFQGVAEELTSILQLLIRNWADEERSINGESVYSYSLLSDEAIACIASHRPKTMEQLQSIWSGDAYVLSEYGPRILAVVQSIHEKYEMNSSADDSTDVDGRILCNNVDWEPAMKDESCFDKDKILSVLPEKLARELYCILKTLRKSWADEERVFLGRTLYDREVISKEALEGISFRAPTTVEQLKGIPAVKDDTIIEYGVRIISVVQMFLEMKKIQGFQLQALSWERQEILISPV